LHQGHFTEDAKIGDLFGKSWDTHWFLVDIEVPEEWLAKEDPEIHFLWNGKCEGSLWTIDGTRLIQAFTENEREIYVIKRKDVKDDLADPTVNKTG
jgi:alpha-mannosidase